MIYHGIIIASLVSSRKTEERRGRNRRSGLLRLLIAGAAAATLLGGSPTFASSSSAARSSGTSESVMIEPVNAGGTVHQSDGIFAALGAKLDQNDLASDMGRGSYAANADTMRDAVRAIAAQEQATPFASPAFRLAPRYVCPTKRYPVGSMENLRVYSRCGSGADELTVTNTIRESLDLLPRLPIQRSGDPPPLALRPLPCGGAALYFSSFSAR